MNYQQVKQFLAIVKHMNLSKAASELYISQPALSLALGRLESELNVQLFYRDGKKLIISPAGEKLYDYFVQLKDAHDRLTDTADSFRRDEDINMMTIGFSVSAMFFSSLYMTGNLGSYDSILLKKIFADSDQILTMLKNGMIDFAVTCPPIEDDKVTTQNIFSENYILVVSSKHPLADRKSISVSELNHIPLTGLKKSQPSREHNDLLCAQNHVDPPYMREFDYPEYYNAVTECAFTDQFANIISESFFEKSYSQGYVAIPFSDGNMVRQTSISWLTESKYNLEYKEILEYIISGIREQQSYYLQFSEIISKSF